MKRDSALALAGIMLVLGIFLGTIATPDHSLTKNTLVCHELFAAQQDTLDIMFRYPECTPVYFEYRKTQSKMDKRR